jgi:uncharacterized peroxidase-related enzyme
LRSVRDRQALSELAEVLLHEPGTLTPAERELIATYVSSRNDCYYCQTAHGAIAAHHLGGNEETVHEVKRDFEHAAISDKLKALLAIAGKVQQLRQRTFSPKMSNGPAARAQPIWRFTTPC